MASGGYVIGGDQIGTPFIMDSITAMSIALTSAASPTGPCQTSTATTTATTAIKSLFLANDGGDDNDFTTAVTAAANNSEFDDLMADKALTQQIEYILQDQLEIDGAAQQQQQQQHIGFNAGLLQANTNTKVCNSNNSNINNNNNNNASNTMTNNLLLHPPTTTTTISTRKSASVIATEVAAAAHVIPQQQTQRRQIFIQTPFYQQQQQHQQQQLLNGRRFILQQNGETPSQTIKLEELSDGKNEDELSVRVRPELLATGQDILREMQADEAERSRNEQQKQFKMKIEEQLQHQLQQQQQSPLEYIATTSANGSVILTPRGIMSLPTESLLQLQRRNLYITNGMPGTTIVRMPMLAAGSPMTVFNVVQQTVAGGGNGAQTQLILHTSPVGAPPTEINGGSVISHNNSQQTNCTNSSLVVSATSTTPTVAGSTAVDLTSMLNAAQLPSGLLLTTTNISTATTATTSQAVTVPAPAPAAAQGKRNSGRASQNKSKKSNQSCQLIKANPTQQIANSVSSSSSSSPPSSSSSLLARASGSPSSSSAASTSSTMSSSAQSDGMAPSTPPEPPVIYQCSECVEKFESKELFDIHCSGHANKMKCRICNMILKSMKNYEKHCMRCKPYECQVCGRVVRFRPNFIKHMRVHTGQQAERHKYKCEVCSKEFMSFEYFKVHKKIHNENVNLTCEICGKVFSALASLRGHSKLHSGVKLHKCDVCGKGFGQRYNLKIHLRTHTGVFPYECSICKKKLHTQSSMQNHMLVHERDGSQAFGGGGGGGGKTASKAANGGGRTPSVRLANCNASASARNAVNGNLVQQQQQQQQEEARQQQQRNVVQWQRVQQKEAQRMINRNEATFETTTTTTDDDESELNSQMGSNESSDGHSESTDSSSSSSSSSSIIHHQHQHDKLQHPHASISNVILHNSNSSRSQGKTAANTTDNESIAHSGSLSRNSSMGDIDNTKSTIDDADEQRIAASSSGNSNLSLLSSPGGSGSGVGLTTIPRADTTPKLMPYELNRNGSAKSNREFLQHMVHDGDIDMSEDEIAMPTSSSNCSGTGKSISCGTTVNNSAYNEIMDDDELNGMKNGDLTVRNGRRNNQHNMHTGGSHSHSSSYPFEDDDDDEKASPTLATTAMIKIEPSSLYSAVPGENSNDVLVKQEVDFEDAGSSMRDDSAILKYHRISSFDTEFDDHHADLNPLCDERLFLSHSIADTFADRLYNDSDFVIDGFSELHNEVDLNYIKEEWCPDNNSDDGFDINAKLDADVLCNGDTSDLIYK